MRWMTWRPMDLADNARHVVGCHVTHESRVQNVLDDEASNICQALIFGPADPTARKSLMGGADVAVVGSGGYCSPRQPPHFEPSSLG
jgi:hypothetical protein